MVKALAYDDNVRMRTMICGANRDGDCPCGEMAVVHRARHKYANDVVWTRGGRAIQHVIVSSHYDLDCPHCGRRTMSEPHDAK